MSTIIPKAVRDHSVPPPTILVVDDEADVLRLVEAILTEQCYRVFLARSPEQAIRLFQRPDRKPDLVLTDVVMPGMSGPMLADHLLALDAEVRVLFMSGYDDRQVVQKYVVDRGFPLIAKPFTIKTLRKIVKDTFEAPSKTGARETAH